MSAYCRLCVLASVHGDTVTYWCLKSVSQPQQLKHLVLLTSALSDISNSCTKELIFFLVD